MSLLKFIAACGAACALAFAPAAHAAAEGSKAKAEARKSAAKSKQAGATKTSAKTKAKPAAAAPNPEADEPEVTGSTVIEYDCELGNKVTLYQNAGDESHVALRWKTRLHRLTRVATTTGAQRFENKHYGLIWIGIPSKGMLLDSKKSRQLANECRNTEQLKPAEAPAVIEAAVPPTSAVQATSATPAAPESRM